MKKQLLAVAVSCLSVFGVQAQGTWVPQATGFPNTSTGVFNISVCDANTVWISSYDGAGTAANLRDFSVTIDGGSTWIPGVVPAPAGHAWSMIHGLDATTAWAIFYNATAGTGGGIWKTTDGGVTWNQQGVGTIFNASSFPNVVHFWNANDGFTMGDPNPTEFELYTTVDGGTTWTPVPAANIPNPLSGEYGITNHCTVVGNTIWFDTNKGRVYKSTDKGLTWTVSSTGITVPATIGAIDCIFWDANNGLARLYDAGVNTVAMSSDGGATWTAMTPTGNMFGSDIKPVPGTASRLVSTGTLTGFIGSSYSDDGGMTWVDIETAAQRTALGVWDAATMWSGGFTTSPSSDGIFKLANIACGDPLVTAGVGTFDDATVCFNDTMIFTTSGIVFPYASGTVYGFAVLVSSGDISGSTDPLAQPGILGGTGVIVPGSTQTTSLINTGTPFAAGVYYLTPVVFANASGTGPVITAYTLDPACTYTGTSQMVTLYAAGDPACAVGLPELNGASLSVSVSQMGSVLNLNIGSANAGQVTAEVYDVTGRMIASELVSVSTGMNSHKMDASTFSAGTYVVRVLDGSNVATTKLVKF
ncbi:MAG: T9SS type A sorting domain-containing protein [Bacteroidetes bacterium]|nr:T9SS type A sorting domain-containing protein [Bacteroidota bacterium]